MASFYLKQGDRLPRLRATLKNGGNAAIDLTGATVQFRMRLKGGTDLAVDAPATVTGATVGEVEYAWADGDTDDVGQFDCEFIVTFPGDLVQTIPPQDFFDVEIAASLVTEPEEPGP